MKRNLYAKAICLIFTVLFFFTSTAAYFGNKVIPSYFNKQLSEKIDIIERRSRNGASFIYITDTHAKSNKMHSPQLIKYVLRKTKIQNVIWGGDAIVNDGGNIEKQWGLQLQFDSVLNNVCNFYKVRGNHDFSILSDEEHPNGLSYSNEKTAELLLNNCPSNVHRNKFDSEACYYYFDDKTYEVRYVIIDTTDSVPTKAGKYGNVTRVRDSQLQWIADPALSTTPKGYGVVLISHVPIANKGYNRDAELKDVRKLIDDFNSHSIGMIRNIKYDFSHLEDVKLLMCISGHKHVDSETYVNGILHLRTANDGRWDKGKGKTSRKEGTVSEQCFDCVCISRNKKIVYTYRIGYGKDRVFHLEPIIISQKKMKKIRATINGVANWTSYNATENKYKDRWLLSNDVIKVENEGMVRGLKEGAAVLVASDKKGNKEFYSIIVK